MREEREREDEECEANDTKDALGIESDLKFQRVKRKSSDTFSLRNGQQLHSLSLFPRSWQPRLGY